MKLRQSRERKKATKKYCARHKIHYHDYCVACELDKHFPSLRGIKK